MCIELKLNRMNDVRRDEGAFAESVCRSQIRKGILYTHDRKCVTVRTTDSKGDRLRHEVKKQLEVTTLILLQVRGQQMLQHGTE